MRRLKISSWRLSLKPKKTDAAVIDRAPFAVLRTGQTYKRALYLGLTVLLALSWNYKEEVRDGLYEISAEQGLAIKELHITGRNFTDHALIIDAIDAPYDSPLLAVDVALIQERLQQLGWIKSARVTRQFPDALSINLDERRPMALLQTAGGHRLIDYDGHIIFSADAANFAHLPVVAGDGAARHAGPLLDALKTEPELFADVWAVHRISDRRWDVFLRSGLEIRLPERDAVLAWSKLAVLDRDTQIMKRDLSMIDLRVPDQLIVQPNLPLGKKGRKT